MNTAANRVAVVAPPRSITRRYPTGNGLRLNSRAGTPVSRLYFFVSVCATLLLIPRLHFGREEVGKYWVDRHIRASGNR